MVSGSYAITRIHSVILAAIIIVAAVAGSLAYFFLNSQGASETIKIGLCVDLDGIGGGVFYKEAVLAVEHINAEGGILGKKLELVAEDDDSETPPFDIVTATNAFTRLITVDNADFILASYSIPIYQEIAAEHKKILLDIATADDEHTQKVIDDYDRYKYYFRTGSPNMTSAQEGVTEALVLCRELTSFSKVALVSQVPVLRAEGNSYFAGSFEKAGFEVVYQADIPYDAVDFSSYFANAEAAGAEIMNVLGLNFMASGAFVTEYYARQSPMVIWGNVFAAAFSFFWDATGGKCEHLTTVAFPAIAGYPFTTKTFAFREAYMERWNASDVPQGSVYDSVRYILADAIRRAGTVETEAVIGALETTDIETAGVRRFVFTSSHDIMIGAAGPNRPSEDYFLVLMFQWQDGKQVPVYPKEIMEEAGATYTFPDWPGPWGK